MDRSGPPWIPTPWEKFSSSNLVDRSSPPYTRFNKIPRSTFKINYIFITSTFIEPNPRWARTVH